MYDLSLLSIAYLFIPYLICSLSFFKNVIDVLIDAIKNKDNHKAMEWSKCPEWLTVEQFYGCKSFNTLLVFFNS